MNQSRSNPPGNKLPENLRVDRVIEAVRRSGYPLQTVVAQALLQTFQIIEEWAYIDRDTQEHRSLDLFASRRISLPDNSRLAPSLALLIECKRAELPYVFFPTAALQIPPGFPAVLGVADEFALTVPGVTTYVPPSTFLRLEDFPFVSRSAPLCNALAKSAGSGSSKLKLSGTVPYRGTILPLISALEHLRRLYRPAQNQARYAPCVTLCICVLDAPMILAGGTPEAPALNLSPWVRVVRGETVQMHNLMAYKHYVVDFIHRDFLVEFIGQHLLPFAQAFSDRVLQGEAYVMAGRAQAPDANWRWEDLKPVA